MNYTQREKNLALLRSVKYDQIDNVRLWIYRGATNIVWAYARACLDDAKKCESYLRKLIIKEGGR